MKTRTLLTTLMLLLLTTAQAQENAVTLPALHVSGNQLVDESGKTVTLHGVMDTPNPYFNRYRWGYDCNRNNVKKCINYFDQLCTAMTDHSQGAYANLLRLYIDACWVNDPNVTAADERDLSPYSPTRLKNYMEWLFAPIIENALKRGMYVSIRPPYGVPVKMQVGDAYQSHLAEVWGIICENATIQKYAGQISIELTNEPITIVDQFGNANNSKLAEYFQPTIDMIRSKDFTGVIWVPGTGYQSNYVGYVNNPPSDNNYGYAVHVYPGWYNQNDDNANGETFIKNFKRQVPVVETHPIFISEVDWSPVNPDGEGHQDEWGNWVQPNYGTWGTGSTSKWGAAFKQMVDHYGNISWTLQGSDLYVDVPAYLADGTVKPAFDGNWECCAAPCFQWFKEYWEAQNTTGVREKVIVKSEKFATAQIYDLQGRRVGSAKANSSLFTLHSSLKKGIYIKNGRKVYIK